VPQNLWVVILGGLCLVVLFLVRQLLHKNAELEYIKFELERANLWSANLEQIISAGKHGAENTPGGPGPFNRSQAPIDPAPLDLGGFPWQFGAEPFAQGRHSRRRHHRERERERKRERSHRAPSMGMGTDPRDQAQRPEPSEEQEKRLLQQELDELLRRAENLKTMMNALSEKLDP
jgi:hypothetical protein